MTGEHFDESSEYAEEAEHERQDEERRILKRWMKKIRSGNIGLAEIPQNDRCPDIIASCISENHAAILVVSTADFSRLYGYEQYIADVFDTSSHGKPVSSEQHLSLVCLYPLYARKLPPASTDSLFIARAISTNILCAFHFDRGLLFKAYDDLFASTYFKDTSLDDVTRNHFIYPCDYQDSDRAKRLINFIKYKVVASRHSEEEVQASKKKAMTENESFFDDPDPDWI